MVDFLLWAQEAVGSSPASRTFFMEDEAVLWQRDLS